jgi:hypothetical protein
LANFFGFESLLEFSTIKYVNQLMPKFVANIHNTLVDDYIKRGFSRLFSIATDTYFSDKNGFIKSSKLKLANLYDKTNDYVITGAILKTHDGLDYLIFDGRGKILGVSQQFFYTLIEEDLGLTLDFFLQKGFIYFWIPTIFEILEQCKAELMKPENLYKTS